MNVFQRRQDHQSGTVESVLPGISIDFGDLIGFAGQLDAQ